MGLKHWFRRRPSDEEIREELEAHVAMRAAHDGSDESAARRRLGNTLHTRETMRRVWVADWWDALRQDTRFTARSWRRHPGFALGAILVLALGLGASTALFAALDRVLFRPLPYADPDRLVSVGTVPVSTDGGTSPFFAGVPEQLLDRFYVSEWDTTPAPFQSVTAMVGTGSQPCQIGEGEPESLLCRLVDHSLLRVLGVRVALGRDFAPEDDVREAPQVALISHALWVRRFGADPGAVDRTMSLERVGSGSLLQVRIVGVLPPDFEMPLETADILLPAQLRPLAPNQPLTSLTVLGRLAPEVAPERARLMLESEWPELGTTPPGFRDDWRVRPLRDRQVGDAALVAWLLMGAVGAFLLIACVNVTNLMLARVAERQREFAVRAAVGAGKARLARLALAESLLVALTAGSLGILVAFGLLQTFLTMAPPGIQGIPGAGPGIPGLAQASVDVRVIAVAGLLIVLTGVTVGLWPAISVFRAGSVQALRPTTAAAPGSRARLRFALVATQIALTLALLGGSALLLRSLWNVVNVPLGFNAERVITLHAALSRVRYPTAERGAVFFDELLARARAMPGTVSVALSDSPPPPMPGTMRLAGLELEGRPAEPDAPSPLVRLRWVTPQYLATFRIPVVRGRTFQEADVAGEPAVALNASAERALFGGTSSLGRRVRLPALPSLPGQPPASPAPWHTVVGVIADLRNGDALTDEPGPEIYFAAGPGEMGGPFAAFSAPRGVLSLRTTAPPADAAAFLRQIAAGLDPQQIVTIQTGDELLSTLTAQPRFVTWLLTAFATLALLLAAAGLYSVASYLVTQRRRDIGVRIALGAAPQDIGRNVIGEAGRWIAAGALLGGALGWIGTRAVQAQLYDVQPLDPWSWAGALLTLALALLVAVVRPAYHAAHVDPIAALRAE